MSPIFRALFLGEDLGGFKMKVGVILAAAGSSRRMGGGKNKVLRMLEGRPILAHSLTTFATLDFVKEIVVVTRLEDRQDVERIASQYGVSVKVVLGGRERQESVYLGLQALSPDVSWVMIHDAARPYVTREIIERAWQACQERKAVGVGVPVTDTIKVVEKGVVQQTLRRDTLWAVQTPQVFARDLITTAHERAMAEGFTATDDCALVEWCGHPVVMVEGDYRNIKITTEADLEEEYASMFPLIGHGYDVHRLVSGRRLILAGVHIPYELGLLGHSDADVAAHAVSDAVLGAAGLGDIGDHFPDTDPRYEGADSMKLLQQIVELAAEHGLQIGNLDLTIMAQRPKLASYKEKMRANLAASLRIPAERVGIKFTTSEGLGFIGRSEGIAAHAVVLLIRV